MYRETDLQVLTVLVAAAPCSCCSTLWFAIRPVEIHKIQPVFEAARRTGGQHSRCVRPLPSIGVCIFVRTRFFVTFRFMTCRLWIFLSHGDWPLIRHEQMTPPAYPAEPIRRG